MEQKKNDKQAKHKRDLKILIILGIVAFILMIVSVIVVLDTAKEAPKLPTEPIGGETPVVPSDGEKEEEGTESPNKDTEESPGGTTENTEETNGESEAKEIEGLKSVDTSTTYVSDNLHITFDIPPSWEGLVEVDESGGDGIIEFLYKGEFFFLSLRAVTEVEYNEDKSFFDSFYKTVLKNKNILILYSLPSEHPLVHDEGSNDFRELNAVMSDNYNLIKTVKAK